MSTLHFTPPNRYDLKQIIIGEATGLLTDLTQVASSLAIGTFPNWISTYDYATASGEYYYAIKWEYINGGYSSWGNRLIGKTGIETNYIIVNAPAASSIYIMTPVSGDVATVVSTWLENNKEYYITIDKTLSGGLTLPMNVDHTFTFTSAYCPLFVSVNEVRYEAGDFLDNISDDTINRIIHKNSSYIINKYYNMMGGLPAGYTCNGDSLNSAFKRYVLCKSALDAITAVQLSTGGRSTKKLADVMFQYNGMDSRRDPINKKSELKDCAEAALNIIFSSENFKIGVRGKYFTPTRHPMNDTSYGRLSLLNKDYRYNMESTFDQIINGEDITGSGV